MDINKDKQFGLLDKISQTVLTTVDASSFYIESRIKEKEESLKNTLYNRWNIPMTSYSVSKDLNNESMYTIINNDTYIVEDGSNKPINVKEAMLTNMKKAALNVDNYSQDIKTENTLKNNSEESITNNSDKSEYSGQFDDFESSILDRLERIKDMRQDLEKSDGDVQLFSAQYADVEKKYKEAEEKNNALEQQIVVELTNQIDMLSRKLKDNDARIVDFKNKINSIIEKTNGLNQKISRKEKILNSIDGNSSMEYSEEQSIRKIA